MAFYLTYNSMLRNDLKHTYFGEGSKSSNRSDGMLSYEPNQFMRRPQQFENWRKKMFPPSDYEDIPPAPAFRIFSRHEMDEVLERLRRNTVATTIYGRRPTVSTICVKDKDEDTEDKPPRHLESSEEQEQLTARLSRPTVASQMRSTRDPNVMLKSSDK